MCCNKVFEHTESFTGQERGTETANSQMPNGLDYFGARYFAGVLGRFTGPDGPLNDQSASDPQSWNLYSYGRNNPLRFIDPTGRACVVGDDGGEYDDNNGGQSCADAKKLARITFRLLQLPRRHQEAAI
jgi:RHS repeat-associated protein